MGFRREIPGIAFALVCLFCLVAGGWSDALAQANFSTKANYAILMDAETKSVLYQKNPDELMAPASMSKLMTLAVVFEKIKTNQLKLEEELFVSENAWRTGGAPSGTSSMFVPLNSSAKVDELLYGIIVQSGNDACIVLAEALSGSEAAFASEMNKYARKIGLKKSEFRNSTGLPNPDHLMTARELALLGIHIIEEYPEFYPRFKLKQFEYRKHKFHNRNPLIYRDIGVDGLKTGYTGESGYGMVASARRGGRRLIAVVNGLKSKRERGAEARKLLEWGYRSFKQFTLFGKEEAVGHAFVWGGESYYLKLVGDGAVKVLLPRFGDKKLTGEIVYKGPLKAPIKKGQQVAELHVTTSTNAVNVIPLYAAEEMKESSFLGKGIDSALFAAFGWIL